MTRLALFLLVTLSAAGAAGGAEPRNDWPGPPGMAQAGPPAWQAAEVSEEEEPAPRAPRQREQTGKDAPRPAPQAGYVVAPSGAPEYLIVGGADALGAAAKLVRERQGEILGEVALSGLGMSMLSIDPGPRIGIAGLRRALERARVRVVVDRNALYAPADAGRNYVHGMVGLENPEGCTLAGRVVIGMIDGPVDPMVANLQGGTFRQKSLLSESEVPGSPEHGTALAALIAGGPGGGFAGGVAQGAQIRAAVAFSARDGRDEMRLDRFAEALDWLSVEGADVINLSVAGPPNRVLSQLLSSTAAHGALIVAASGNDGSNRVSHPAADRNVIGVIAVDARKRRLREANFGSEIDFAAPGTDVLVPVAGTTAYRSGTSYAAAIASGLIAHAIEREGTAPATVLAILANRAEDLGRPGRDDQFGWGLLRAECRG